MNGISGLCVIIHHSLKLSNLSATNSDLFFRVPDTKTQTHCHLPLLSLILSWKKQNTVLLCALLFLLFFWYLHNITFTSYFFLLFLCQISSDPTFLFMLQVLSFSSSISDIYIIWVFLQLHNRSAPLDFLF